MTFGTTSKSGFFVGSAYNQYGSGDFTGKVFVSDLDKAFDIIGKKDFHFVEDNVSVTCAAAKYKYTEINWYKDYNLNDKLKCK